MNTALATPQPPRVHLTPFWAIFRHSANPMLLADDSRRYIEVNDAAVSITGYGRDLLLTMRIDELAPPEYRAHVGPAWQEFLRAGTKSGDFALQCADGTVKVVGFHATARILPNVHLSIFLLKSRDDAQAGPVAVEEGGASSPRALSPREREVLGRVALGRCSADVADDLGIAVDTVRRHVQNAMRKLGAHTRAQAIGAAMRAGIL